MSTASSAIQRLNEKEYYGYALAALGSFAIGALGASMTSLWLPSFVLFSSISCLIILGFADVKKMIVAYLFLTPIVNINLLLEDLAFMPDFFKTRLAGKGLHFDGIAIILVVLFWLAHKKKLSEGHPWERNFYLLWTVFLLFSAVTIGVNRDYALFSQMWHFTELAAYLGISIVFLSEFREMDSARRAGAAMAAGISIASLTVLLDVFLRNLGVEEIPFYYWSQRTIDSFKGTINHRNYFGGMLLLVMPLSAAWLFYIKKNLRFGFWPACLALQAAAFAVTRSKGAMAGLLVFGLVLLMKIQWSRKAKLVFISGIMAVSLAGSYFALRTFESSWSVRNYIYRVSLPMVLDAPFFGHGLNSFPEVFLKYEKKVVGGKLPEYRYTKQGVFLGGVSSHNSFLTHLGEKGVLGLASFTALIGFSIFLLLRGGGFRGRHPVAIVAGAAISGLCVQALTDDIFSYSKLFVLFWAVFAVGMSVQPAGDSAPARPGGGGKSE